MIHFINQDIQKQFQDFILDETMIEMSLELISFKCTWSCKVTAFLALLPKNRIFETSLEL